MKHIDVQYHFIHWVIEQGSLCVTAKGLDSNNRHTKMIS